MKLSCIVVARNEEDQLASCLKTVSFADEIIVINDSSIDKTPEVAKKHGVRVIDHDGNYSFAEKRNFGLTHAKGDWVLFIDADERVPDALREEIIEAVHRNQYDGYFLLRSDTLFGKTLRFGESANYPLLRLAKKNAGEWVGDVHETWIVKGKTTYLKHTLEHFPHQTVASFLKKINYYSDLRAAELLRNGETSSAFSIVLYTKGKFFQNYIIKLGILDGMPGLVSALMMSFYSFLVRGKLWQLKKIEKLR